MKGSAKRNCRTMLERISAYLDGDLAAADCRAIERHCRSCVRCASAVEELRHTIGLCRAAGRRPLPETVRRRARQSVRQLLAADKLTRRSR